MHRAGKPLRWYTWFEEASLRIVALKRVTIHQRARCAPETVRLIGREYGLRVLKLGRTLREAMKLLVAPGSFGFIDVRAS